MAQMESRNEAIDKHFKERKSFDRQRDSIIDEGFDQQAQKLHEHSERLDRHRNNSHNHRVELDLLMGRSEEMRGRHEDLVNRVVDMASQLCHCARSVPISQVSEHSGLEYSSDDSYHLPPQEPCSHCSSNHVVPEENTIPIPVPAPVVSNDENVDPSGSVRPTAPRLVRRQVLRRLGMPFRRAEARISTGVVVGGVRRHRVCDIPRRVSESDGGVGEVGESIDRADSPSLSRSGLLAPSMAITLPGPSLGWGDSDEWVPIVGRVESRGGGSSPRAIDGGSGSGGDGGDAKVGGSPEL